jgi:tellurite resistance protein
LVSKGGAALGDKLDRTKKTDEAVKTALEKGTNAAGERIVSVKDSLKLIYCLMAADGSISPEEEEKFREIGNSLDPDFEQWKGELTADLSMKEAVLPDEDEYFDFIHDYAAEILYKAEDTGEGIGAKTLIWDLLVMAFSEGDYSANERRLVRFAAKALSIDPAIPLEMEQTLRTITALDKEEEWLKSMNRPYSVIEEQVNELKERRETIMTGVHALIED